MHVRLPVQHDPIWDGLAKIGRPLTESLAIGTSAGLAYHLLVDAFVQPGAYHGVPFHMPMEAHQTIFAANGVIEGEYAASRMAERQPAEIIQGGVPAKSPGRRFVDAVANASKTATADVKNAFKKGRS